MEGKRLIEKIKLRNILSFGDKGEEIELQPLNVIIGQNASGKSNLVDVIKLLRSLPQDKGLADFISKNGGIGEWFWKGKKESENAIIGIAFNEISTNYEIELRNHPLFGLFILDEKIKISNETTSLVSFNRKQIISSEAPNEEFSFDDSVLGKFLSITIDEEKYSFYFISFILRRMKIYSDLETNRKSEIRKPQILDAKKSFLAEDGSNLSLVLNELERKGNIKDIIIENLRKFYSQIKDYSFEFTSEYIQFYLRENLEKPISAMRLSDGTLRYLCLLAILCHPEPPPLICIEEPETGLHPDILPTIAELMKDAATRTQLIVTTHSDILVSAFSDMPEAVLVCEKDEDGTHFKRLEAENLKTWLEEYTLGEVWLRGGIGGTRW
ncbi:MAG TPA: AAA family ATPase [Pyrinomonadaceae bacterium]|nr:AAA family ATPase [Pyrinomonadaceae bacterium]